jgi:hypothetical protein
MPRKCATALPAIARRTGALCAKATAPPLTREMVRTPINKRVPTQQQVDPAEAPRLFDAVVGNGAWATYQTKK